MTGKNSTTSLVTPSDREIVITRSFSAPRRLVFEALTIPKHVKRWYGVSDLAMVVCEIDLQVGGRWRYVLRDPDGNEYGFSGVYREIIPPERLVYSEGFEGMPDHEALVTLTLSEQDGKTHYHSHIRYASVEDRDAHIQSGMEQGAIETLDRLNEHLQTMLFDTTSTE